MMKILSRSILILCLLSPIFPADAQSNENLPLPHLPSDYTAEYDFERRDISSVEDRKSRMKYAEENNQAIDRNGFLSERQTVSGHIVMTVTDRSIYYRESRGNKKYRDVYFNDQEKSGFVLDYLGKRLTVLSRLNSNDTEYIPFPAQDATFPQDAISTSKGVALTPGRTITRKATVNIAGQILPIDLSVFATSMRGEVDIRRFVVQGEHGKMAEWKFDNLLRKGRVRYPRDVTRYVSIGTMPLNYKELLQQNRTVVGDYWKPSAEIKYKNIAFRPAQKEDNASIEMAVASVDTQTAIQESRQGKSHVAFYYKPDQGSLDRQVELALLDRKSMQKDSMGKPGGQGYFLLTIVPLVVGLWFLYRNISRRKEGRGA